MILFNRPIRAPFLQCGREPIKKFNDDEYYKALKSRQEMYSTNDDTHNNSTLFSSGSAVVVQMEDRSPWMHGMVIEGNSKDH